MVKTVTIISSIAQKLARFCLLKFNLMLKGLIIFSFNNHFCLKQIVFSRRRPWKNYSKKYHWTR